MDNVVENKVDETKENVQTNNEIKEKPIEETQEQINWKRFREAREQERKQKELIEKDAAKKAEEIAALKAAMEALVNKPNAQIPNNYSDNSEGTTIDEERKIEEKIQKILSEKERSYEEQRRAREQQEMPNKLVSTFSDFNNVCTTENLDYLEYHFPEVAAPFKHLPDSFEKWAQIYKAVKRFVPNPDSNRDSKKAEKNFNKPQSMSVSGRTQTTDSLPAFLDDKRKADNWARMQKRMKGIT